MFGRLFLFPLAPSLLFISVLRKYIALLARYNGLPGFACIPGALFYLTSGWNPNSFWVHLGNVRIIIFLSRVIPEVFDCSKWIFWSRITGLFEPFEMVQYL